MSSDRLSPLRTYREFVSKQRDDADANAFQRRFNEYRRDYAKELMRRFFERNADFEWFKQRYDPAMLCERVEGRRRRAADEAARFHRDLDDVGPSDFAARASLDPPKRPDEAEAGADDDAGAAHEAEAATAAAPRSTKKQPGPLEDHLIDFERSAHAIPSHAAGLVVLIPAVPPAVSKASLAAAVAAALDEAGWADPTPPKDILFDDAAARRRDGFEVDAWLMYDDADTAAKVETLLAKTKLFAAVAPALVTAPLSWKLDSVRHSRQVCSAILATTAAPKHPAALETNKNAADVLAAAASGKNDAAESSADQKSNDGGGGGGDDESRKDADEVKQKKPKKNEKKKKKATTKQKKKRRDDDDDDDVESSSSSSDDDEEEGDKSDAAAGFGDDDPLRSMRERCLDEPRNKRARRFIDREVVERDVFTAKAKRALLAASTSGVDDLGRSARARRSPKVLNLGRSSAQVSERRRLAFDAEQARTLAAALDEAADIPTQARLGPILDAHFSDNAAVCLDVAAAYLRRVHLFLYYGAIQCRDEVECLTKDALWLTRRDPARPKVLDDEKTLLEEARSALDDTTTNTTNTPTTTTDDKAPLTSPTTTPTTTATKKRARDDDVDNEDAGARGTTNGTAALTTATTTKPPPEEETAVVASENHKDGRRDKEEDDDDDDGHNRDDDEDDLGRKRRRDSNKDEAEEEGPKRARVDSESLATGVMLKRGQWGQMLNEFDAKIARRLNRARADADQPGGLFVTAAPWSLVAPATATTTTTTTKAAAAVQKVNDGGAYARAWTYRLTEDLQKLAASELTRLDEARDAFVKFHASDEDEGRARCGFDWCKKLFKSHDFLKKHVVNRHADYCDAWLTPSRRPFMFELYDRDAKKPLPPLRTDGSGPDIEPLDLLQAGAPGINQRPFDTQPRRGRDGNNTNTPPFDRQRGRDQRQGPKGGGDRGSGGQFGRGRGQPGASRYPTISPRDRLPPPDGAKLGAPDPRKVTSYADVDAPSRPELNLDFGVLLPPSKKKKKKTNTAAAAPVA